MRVRKHSRCGGFTLVELVVSTAVLFILLAGILTAILPGFRFFETMDKQTSAKMLSTTLSSYIADRVRYTTELSIGSGAGEILKVEDGILQDSEGGAPSADFYDGMTVNITFAGDGAALLSFTIEVMEADGSVIHSETNTIKLVNLELLGKSIQTGVGNSAVSFSLEPPA